jgi:hypothetical protein
MTHSSRWLSLEVQLHPQSLTPAPAQLLLPGLLFKTNRLWNKRKEQQTMPADQLSCMV